MPDYSLDEKAIEQAEERRQMRLVAGFLPAILAVSTLHAWRGFSNGILIEALMQGSAVVAMLLTGLRMFFGSGKAIHVKLTIAFFGIGSVMGSLVGGGADGAAAYWLVGYPPASFLLVGARYGIIANGLLLASLFTYWMLVWFGGLASPYTVHQLQDIFAVTILMSVVGYIGESGWDRARSVAVSQRSRLATLLKNLPVGVMLISSKTKRVLVANEAVTTFLGLKPKVDDEISSVLASAKLIKSGTGKAYPENELPTAVAASGGSSLKNDVARGEGEDETVLRMLASPLLDSSGNVEAIMVIIEDATKESRISKLKSEFVAVASHQLKAPLSTTKWTSEILMAGDEGELNDGQKNLVLKISAVTDRLLLLVKDLLNVSHIETGRKFHLEPELTDVAGVMNEILQEDSSAAAARGIEFDVSLESREPSAWVDRKKLREALANLVSNAVKYSPDGSRVKVRLYDPDQEMLGVDVSDKGIGIPKAEQDKLFTKFFRAENVGDVEGTGLGLYVVRAVIERSGGQIWFESEEGKGTTFRLRLPKARIDAKT